MTLLVYPLRHQVPLPEYFWAQRVRRGVREHTTAVWSGVWCGLEDCR